MKAASVLRAAGWACVAVIAILSLLPAESMARTDLGGHVEHALAYAGTAFLMGLGYREYGAVRISAAFVAYAGLLELLQLFSPGRHPGLDGWIASSAGAVVGTSVARLAFAVWTKKSSVG